MHVRATDGRTVLGENFVGSDQMPDPGSGADLTIRLDPIDRPAWNPVVDRRVQWVMYDYSLDNGQTWRRFAVAGPKQWYVIPSLARLLPENDRRYDLGLDKVVQYAAGLRDTQAIAGAMNSGIDREIVYDPDHDFGGHVLLAYWHQRALCMINARLLEYLLRASGVLAEVRTTWGGSSSDRVDYFPHDSYAVSLQVQAPAHDLAPPDPHFSYHAITLVSDTYYDPSYGTKGAPTILKVCQPYSISEGNEVICGPPDPMFIPRQQWGTDFPPADEEFVPCDSAPPP